MKSKESVLPQWWGRDEDVVRLGVINLLSELEKNTNLTSGDILTIMENEIASLLSAS